MLLPFWCGCEELMKSSLVAKVIWHLLDELCLVIPMQYTSFYKKVFWHSIENSWFFHDFSIKTFLAMKPLFTRYQFVAVMIK